MYEKESHKGIHTGKCSDSIIPINGSLRAFTIFLPHKGATKPTEGKHYIKLDNDEERRSKEVRNLKDNSSTTINFSKFS